MAGMSNYLEQAVGGHIFRSSTFSKPSELWISLHTGDPGDTGVSEVSGGSYGRQQLDPDDANWSAITSAGITKNLVAVTFSAPSADWGTVSHVAVWDAATDGNVLAIGSLDTPVLVENGDGAPFFDIEAIVVTLT